MANPKHLEILREGVAAWNQWLASYTGLEVNLESAELNGAELSGIDFHLTFLNKIRLRESHLGGANLKGAMLFHADLYKADLRAADLSEASLCYGHLDGANFSGADLREANLSDAFVREVDLRKANLTGAFLFRTLLAKADLRGANLSGAHLDGANLSDANLSGTCLSRARLNRANFTGTDLSDADLTDADLSGATLVGTRLARSNLTNCNVYGVSAWNVELIDAIQTNLVITPKDEPTITVDNLEVAQFVYLLLNNTKIREVIDTVAKRAVLILGRFTLERKAILDSIKVELRARGYLPILFDFDKPSSQDLSETVSTLAHISRFIVVDLTDPSSTPYEVGMIASNHIKPIQALFQPSAAAKSAFAMFPDLVRRYHWVLPPYAYQDREQLLASLHTNVIEPAEQKIKELQKP